MNTVTSAQNVIFVNQKFVFVPGLFYEDNLDFSYLSVKGVKQVTVETCWNDYWHKGDTVEVYEEVSHLASVFFDKKGRQTMIIYEHVDTVVYGNFHKNQWGYRYVYGYSDSVQYDFDKKGRPIACRYSLNDTLYKVQYDELGNITAFNKHKTAHWIYQKNQIIKYQELHEGNVGQEFIYNLNKKDTSIIKTYYSGWHIQENDCDSAYFLFTQNKSGKPIWIQERYYLKGKIQLVESHYEYSKNTVILTSTNSDNVRANYKYVFEYGKRGELLVSKFYENENLMSAESYLYIFY